MANGIALRRPHGAGARRPRLADEITLTNRERMELPMLIGREALAGHALVDAGQS